MHRRAAALGAASLGLSLGLGLWTWCARPHDPDSVQEPTAEVSPAGDDREPPPIVDVRAPEPAPMQSAGRPTPPQRSPPPEPPPAEEAREARAARRPESGPYDLLMPVDGVGLGGLHDDFDDARGSGRRHEAIDILAPRDTPVRAVADGTVAKLFESVAGGHTIYQFDPAGRYCYYYAHLERYARGLAEGDRVRRGQIVGYVGTSGNAPPDTPHLHFAVYRLGPERRWWEGEPLNPYPLLRGES